MKIVTIGFSSRRGVLSYLIKALTGSKVSHAYIRKQSPVGTDIVFQASGVAVNICAYEHFSGKASVIEEISVAIPEELFNDGETFLWQEVGKPYAYKQLIGYLWVVFWRALRVKVKRNPLADGTHAYVCAELVARYLGLEDTESLTQEDLYQHVKCLLTPSAVNI